jgi:murein DD-endopeptidase MepM/ murein hydrolase activator NlpD
MRRKRNYTFLWVLILIIVVIGGGWLGVALYMGSAPDIIIGSPPTHLGSKAKLKFTIHDSSQKLSKVRVSLIQGTREKVVFEQRYNNQQPPQTKRDLVVDVRPKANGITQGPAKCIIQAWGRSLGDFYQGRTTRREMSLTVDTVPPRVSMISRTINIRMGGSGLAIYKLSPDVTAHGIKVGKYQYPGNTPWTDHPHTALSYFALAQDQKRNEIMQVWAEDAAGNRTEMPLPVRVRRKRFRNDRIRLSTRTIKALAAKFSDQAPPEAKDDVAVFVWINTTFRKANDIKVFEVTHKVSPKQFWQGAFARPRGKPMAGFGDRRTYYRGKKKISKAVHLGSDLADIAQSDIRATARGRVVFAAFLGIYGNCLILDHGLGVMSLYGHLSHIAVTPGQIVDQGQVVAQSGATGLALGDHLHFSVLVGGVFVLPTEWWDEHWIEDNITLRFTEADLQPPMDIAPKKPKAKKAKESKTSKDQAQKPAEQKKNSGQ